MSLDDFIFHGTLFDLTEMQRNDETVLKLLNLIK